MSRKSKVEKGKGGKKRGQLCLPGELFVDKKGRVEQTVINIGEVTINLALPAIGKGDGIEDLISSAVESMLEGTDPDLEVLHNIARQVGGCTCNCHKAQPGALAPPVKPVPPGGAPAEEVREE